MARKRSNVVPLRAVRNRPRERKGGRGFGLFMVAAPLAAFTAVFVYDGGPPGAALDAPQFADLPESQVAWPDTETARFSQCSGPVRVNCVIDGDTFWYAGEKIRIADINTPETSEPQCAREAQLGARATARLQALLNEGAFTLESVDRDRDSYGRLLRTVTRDGTSLGAVLVREGLAEEWRGYRSGWC